jgi:hypothetical protein
MSRRVLIFDVNNEYGEYGIKTIGMEHIPVFMQHPKCEIRRIAPFMYTPKGQVKMTTNDMLDTLEKIVNMYQGGALVVEDPSKFFSKSVSEDLIGSICTNRHNSCDMILHYQSVGRILPVLHENINIYRFHHQGDDVNRSANKLQDQTQIFKITQLLVDEQYYRQNNKRFFAYIDKDSGKVMGDFSKQQFDKALDDYIKFNTNELKPWTAERDNAGKKVYTYPMAVAKLKDHMSERYWGNDTAPDDTREAKMMVAIGFKGVGKTYETMRMLKEEYCPMVA